MDLKLFRRWVLSCMISNTYYHNFVTHLLEAAYQREVYKIVDAGGSVPTVPGSVPGKPGMSMGMAPGTTESCTKCGLCAEKCPVGAIDAKTLEADKKKCISCMRCISVCPQGARKLNVMITSLGGVALGVLCKKRKECELFL